MYGLAQASLKNNIVSGGPPDWISFSGPLGRIFFFFFFWKNLGKNEGNQ